MVKNENMVFNTSRNTISVLLLFLCCLDIFFREKDGISIDYKKIVITVLLSLLAKGRSGIIISLLFAFIVICHQIFSRKNKSKIKTIIFIVGCCVILAYSINWVDQYLESFSRWGMETNRTDFWSDYADEVNKSVGNTILGANLHNLSILRIYDYNLHNSFIMLHANYGIIPFVFVLITLIYGMISAIKNKKFIMFLFIVILALKGNIDYVIFHSYCDVLFFMIFLDIIKSSKDRRRIRSAQKNDTFTN